MIPTLACPPAARASLPSPPLPNALIFAKLLRSYPENSVLKANVVLGTAEGCLRVYSLDAPPSTQQRTETMVNLRSTKSQPSVVETEEEKGFIKNNKFMNNSIGVKRMRKGQTRIGDTDGKYNDTTIHSTPELNIVFESENLGPISAIVAPEQHHRRPAIIAAGNSSPPPQRPPLMLLTSDGRLHIFEFYHHKEKRGCNGERKISSRNTGSTASHTASHERAEGVVKLQHQSTPPNLNDRDDDSAYYDAKVDQDEKAGGRVNKVAEGVKRTNEVLEAVTSTSKSATTDTVIMATKTSVTNTISSNTSNSSRKFSSQNIGKEKDKKNDKKQRRRYYDYKKTTFAVPTSGFSLSCYPVLGAYSSSVSSSSSSSSSHSRNDYIFRAIIGTSTGYIHTINLRKAVPVWTSSSPSSSSSSSSSSPWHLERISRYQVPSGVHTTCYCTIQQVPSSTSSSSSSQIDHQQQTYACPGPLTSSSSSSSSRCYTKPRAMDTAATTSEIHQFYDDHQFGCPTADMARIECGDSHNEEIDRLAKQLDRYRNMFTILHNDISGDDNDDEYVHVSFPSSTPPISRRTRGGVNLGGGDCENEIEGGGEEGKGRGRVPLANSTTIAAAASSRWHDRKRIFIGLDATDNITSEEEGGGRCLSVDSVNGYLENTHTVVPLLSSPSSLQSLRRGVVVVGGGGGGGGEASGNEEVSPSPLPTRRNSTSTSISLEIGALRGGEVASGSRRSDTVDNKRAHREHDSAIHAAHVVKSRERGGGDGGGRGGGISAKIPPPPAAAAAATESASNDNNNNKQKQNKNNNSGTWNGNRSGQHVASSSSSSSSPCSTIRRDSIIASSMIVKAEKGDVVVVHNDNDNNKNDNEEEEGKVCGQQRVAMCRNADGLVQVFNIRSSSLVEENNPWQKEGSSQHDGACTAFVAATIHSYKGEEEIKEEEKGEDVEKKNESSEVGHSLSSKGSSSRRRRRQMMENSYQFPSTSRSNRGRMMMTTATTQDKTTSKSEAAGSAVDNDTLSKNTRMDTPILCWRAAEEVIGLCWASPEGSFLASHSTLGVCTRSGLVHFISFQNMMKQHDRDDDDRNDEVVLKQNETEEEQSYHRAYSINAATTTFQTDDITSHKDPAASLKYDNDNNNEDHSFVNDDDDKCGGDCNLTAKTAAKVVSSVTINPAASTSNNLAFPVALDFGEDVAAFTMYGMREQEGERGGGMDNSTSPGLWVAVATCSWDLLVCGPIQAPMRWISSHGDTHNLVAAELAQEKETVRLARTIMNDVVKRNKSREVDVSPKSYSLLNSGRHESMLQERKDGSDPGGKISSNAKVIDEVLEFAISSEVAIAQISAHRDALLRIKHSIHSRP